MSDDLYGEIRELVNNWVKDPVAPTNKEFLGPADLKLLADAIYDLVVKNLKE